MLSGIHPRSLYQVRQDLEIEVIIRVLTQKGPRDIDVTDWNRVESMLAGVSVMDLCVPEDPLCPAMVLPENEERYARLREGVQRVMNRYDWKMDDNWAIRHSDWVGPGGRYNVGGAG